MNNREEMRKALNELLEREGSQFGEHQFDMFRKGYDAGLASQAQQPEKLPPDYSFESINNFVHCEDPQYEELQSLCLGMASRIAELELNLEAGDIALGNEKIFNKQEHIESNQEIYDTELGDVLFALENAVEELSKFEHIDTVEPYIKAKEKLARFINQPKAIESAQDNEGWIDWNGGNRPLNQYDDCEVEFNNGRILKGKVMNFIWDHDGAEDDIIKYRIAKESQ
jgi:hypothetical protein